MIPTIEWHGNHVRMVDQRKLPWAVNWYRCRGYKDVIRAIEKMVIRGAPAIGVAAAMGLALGAQGIRADSHTAFSRRFKEMADEMMRARPTAVNLKWAVERMKRRVAALGGDPVDEIRRALKQEAEAILAEDIEINRQMGRIGQHLVPEGATILTHCNAGALATGGYGTALGVIRAAHENNKHIKVIADETRPWLQGLRLMAFELMQDGIPVSVIADNAAGFLMRQRRIDLVITGADRIAANGDVANKIGTLSVAILANHFGIPVYIAAPSPTIDMGIATGKDIPIEERDPWEITHWYGHQIAPEGVKVYNPAFDVTPHALISAIVTDKGIVTAPFEKNMKKLFGSSIC